MFRRLFRRLKKEEGFTLVELMVVIMIIGILVAIAVPMYNTSQAHAQERACQANLRIIDGAIMQYLAAEGLTPAEAPTDFASADGVALDEDHPLITNGFLEKAPQCPTTKTNYTIKIVTVGGQTQVKAVCPKDPPHTY